MGERSERDIFLEGMALDQEAAALPRLDENPAKRSNLPGENETPARASKRRRAEPSVSHVRMKERQDARTAELIEQARHGGVSFDPNGPDQIGPRIPNRGYAVFVPKPPKQSGN